MLRKGLERDLQRMQDEVVLLASMVKRAIHDAVVALQHQDLAAAERIMDADQEINRKRFDTESEVLVLIARQQPMAGDLRILAAVLEIVTELERMGDYAKGIAKITLLMGHEPPIKPLVDIPRMADLALGMLDRAIDAFLRRDVALARSIPTEDDLVDDLYNQVNRELLALILANPRNMEQANYLTWAAHNLERAADRVTNICERVVFMVTGEMNELDQPPAEGEEKPQQL
ncbi:MAG: phosphate signaling complex protein PhoU [Anaerolineales bacterium]